MRPPLRLQMATVAALHAATALTAHAPARHVTCSLFAAVYERGKAAHAVPHDDDCLYADCFALSYLISAAGCLAAAVCSIELARRTRPRYRHLSR